MKDIGDERKDMREGREFKALTLDLEHYEAMLDMPGLTPEERKDILQALWTIICCFVELGFTPGAQTSCGQLTKSKRERTVPPGDVVKSEEDQLTSIFVVNAAKAQREREES